MMRKTRKKYLTILIAFLMAALVLCGTVIAYMFRQTEYEDNQFSPSEVSCKVEEEFDGKEKTNIRVKNTGNIDAYLRVRLVSYWVDAEGNIVAKPSEKPSFELAAGWVSGSDNTYYYQSPVEPEALTPNLLSSALELKKDDDGYLQVVEVFAEAIQSEPENSVTSAWEVTLDTDGNITAAP